MRNKILKVSTGCFFFMVALCLNIFGDTPPWFEVVDGRPIYGREHSPGLPENYGRVGENGLIWYAGFENSLKAEYLLPDNPSDILSVKPELPGAGFVQGVTGHAFYASGGEDNILLNFTGIDGFTPLERGSLVLWMNTEEGSLFSNTFDIFRLLGQLFQHRTHAPHHLGFQFRGESGVHTAITDSYFTAALTNDLKGWNMYAYTWDTGNTKFYANGFLVAEHAIPVGTYKWSQLVLGPRTGQASRAYDEVAFYNRVLSQGELRRQYLALLQPIKQNILSVPPASGPVKIDGVIDEHEWRNSVSTRGFVEGSPVGEIGSGQLAEPQNELFLQYDDRYLYIACRSPWPEEILAAREITAALTGGITVVSKQGDIVDPMAEDAFELLIANPEDAEGRIYRILINGGNVVSDGIITARSDGNGKETDYTWDSGWSVITRETIEGEWLFEAAVPFSALGISPAGGALLEFNMVRHWQLMQKGSDSWQWGRRVNDKTGGQYGNTLCIKDTSEVIPMGRLVLGRSVSPVIKVTGLGELLQGELDFEAEVYNPGSRPLELNFQLRTNTVREGRFAPSFLIADKSMAVEPGQRGRFTYAEQIEDYGDNMLLLQVYSGREKVYQNTWHFIREESLDIYVKKFPSAGKAAALINCSLLAGYEPSELTARLYIRDEAGNEYASFTSESFKTYSELVTIDISGLLPGDYTLGVEILAEGVIVASQEQYYVHNPLPRWLGNDYGWNFNEVPPPFSPVKREGNTLAVWHREYEFGEGVLPSRISTQGWEILRKPVDITAVLADGSVIKTSDTPALITWDDNTSIVVGRQAEGRIVEAEKSLSPGIRRAGNARIEKDGLLVKNDFWIEYDGLLWNSIKIESEAEMEISELYIEVPLSEFFSADILPGWTIPAAGSDRIIQWIGNGYGGLQPIVRTSPSGVVRGNISSSAEGALYRISLLDETTRISDLGGLEFSLQATPVKARYPEYRRFNWGMEGSKVFFDIAGTYPRDQFFVPATDGYRKKLIYTQGDEEPIVFGPNRRFYEEYHGYKPAARVYAAPYFYFALNVNVPEAEDFKDEWLASTRGNERVAPGAMAVRRLSSSFSTREYFLWRYGQLMEKVPFGAIYFDGTSGLFNSPSHPILREAPGAMHPILESREIIQRLYNLVKNNYPDGMLYAHLNRVDGAIVSFFNFQGDGEQDWPAHYEGMENFEGVMPLEKYRTKYMGHNHGLVGNWIPKLVNKSFLTRQAQRQTGAARPLAEHGQSIKLLHDSATHIWRYDFVGEYSARLGNALEKHGWGDDYLTIPYWDQQIAQLPGNMYASFYVRPAGGGPAPETFDTAGYYLRTMEGSEVDKVICIFANESDWEGGMRVDVDWQKLGFNSPAGLRVENAVHRLKVNYTNPEYVNSNDVHLPEDWYEFVEDPAEYARIEDGQLVFPVTRWNYRMIVIERP